MRSDTTAVSPVGRSGIFDTVLGLSGSSGFSMSGDVRSPKQPGSDQHGRDDQEGSKPSVSSS